MKNSIEAHPPGSDCVFIVIHAENTRGGFLFVRIDDALDLCYGPAIEGVISKSGNMRVSTGSTHLVNCSIASNTGQLN